MEDGREGLLHNKPVQGLRLTYYITGFMPNQLQTIFKIGSELVYFVCTVYYEIL